MISEDPYLKDVFPKPPLTAFKKQTNIQNILIKSKLPCPPRHHEKRKVNGMSKCGKACTACPFINEVKVIKIKNDSYWKINRMLTCDNSNIIYMIQCNIDRCLKRYIGECKHSLHERLSDHRGYISNQVISQATGAHFNLPGHSLANLTITILEIVKNNDDEYRKQREKYFIRKFNTYYEGLNRQQ